MKKLRLIFDKMQPSFTEGGRFARLKPVFDALDSFFFAPSTQTITPPHARDPLDIKRFMVVVIVAVLPCLLMSLYYFGVRILAMLIVSYTAGGAVEVAFAIIRKEKIYEGFLVTGMLFPLILPPTLPLWMVALGIVFGVVVGKELFGGTARNLFNPAIVGRCFLALAYPAAMAATWVIPGRGPTGRLFQYVTNSTTDAVTAATPLAAAGQNNWNAVALSDLFLGRISGSMGETCSVAIIIGGVFLLLTRVSSWRTVLGVIAGAALTAKALNITNPAEYAPMTWTLLAGSLLFGAFYMATDPVTSPVTGAAKWVHGALIGVLVILIRNFTPLPEGVMFAILCGNIIAPILDEIVFAAKIRRLNREG